jgi:hypothetical protein
MRRIAHIVNPFAAAPSSAHQLAQAVTFETMRCARDYARGQVDVTLLAAQFPEDRGLIPEPFELTPDLDRSVLDFAEFRRKRRLPLLQDILARLHQASAAEYFVYTNVDIALTPVFYTTVDHLIDRGFDAFSVTRRTISAKFSTLRQLPAMYAEVGNSHPGTDCFVFKRSLVPQLYLANACLGAFYIAKNFQLNLICNSENYRKLTDLHITFHLGDDRAWADPDLADYSEHNEREIRKVITHYETARAVPDRCEFYLRLLACLERSRRMRKYEKHKVRYFFPRAVLGIAQRLKRASAS